MKEEVLEAAKIGKVPTAGTADNATNATNAGNATTLGGSPAGNYAKDLSVLPVVTGPVLVLPNSDSPKQNTRTCPTGQRLVSGGYVITGDGRDNVTVNEARVSPDGRSYIVEATEIQGNPNNDDTWTLSTRIICATAN